jgi:RecA-family ATPase
VVESLLVQWNSKNKPPMSLDELQTTIKSIERYQTDDFRIELIPDEEPAQAKTSGGMQVPQLQQPKKHEFDLLPMGKYFKKFGTEGVDWAIQDWMPDKSVVFVISPPEGYKTWILLDLAVSLASGLPFLGHQAVHKQGPVIIVQQEDSHAGIVERLSVILKSRLNLQVEMGEECIMPAIPDIPIFIHPSRSLRFGDKQVMADLEIAIKEVKPVCVIIDPLYSTTSTDNYMAQATDDMFKLKQFRDQYGCSFVIAHHSKKNVDPNSTSREDSWGSQFLNAFLEAGWQIRRSLQIADNEIIVRRHSKTMGNQKLVKLAFDISTRHPMHYDVTVSDYNVAVSSGRPAQNRLYDMLENGPKTMNEISNESGKHKSTVSRQLKKLEDDKVIQRLPDGRYKIIKNEEGEET